MSRSDVSILESGLDRAELTGLFEKAVARAGRLGRPVLASLSVEVAAAELDVAAAIFESRRAEERYFVWEKPESGFSLGCLGSAWTVEGLRGERFPAASARCAEALRDAVVQDAPRLAGGPVWFGGFAFDPSGGHSGHWGSLPSTLLVLPSLSLLKRDGDTVATVNAVCRSGDDPEAVARASAAHIDGLRAGSIPLIDPDPLESPVIFSPLPPEHFVGAVAEGRDRIRAGELKKVVLAREVLVGGPAPFRPSVVFDGLRAGFPSCFCFCVGTPEAAFVGASPELLVRREGATVSTVAMAGSTRRSADPAVDDHLGQRLLQSAKDRAEHEIVARRIERSLEPVSVWVAAEVDPALVKVANIQHLATPVRAQLADPLSAVDLVGVLHPTPAVGGEPWERARDVMRREQLDRGWYAGPVGWMDSTEDGEFCVALRCALLQGATAHCYAGVGVVADSDPEAELAETEVKLEALLTVLTGA